MKTLRSKLVLSALLIELCMLSLLIANSVRITTETYTEQVQTAMDQLVPVLNAALVSPMVQQDWSSVHAILEESAHLKSMDYLAVTLPDGNSIARVGWPENKPLPEDENSISLIPKPDGSLRYDQALPLEYAGDTLGTIHLGMNLNHYSEVRGQLLSECITIAGAEITLTAILMTLLALWLTRHFKTLEIANRSLLRGEYHPLKRSNDTDIDLLIDAYNNLGRYLEDKKNSESRLKMLANAFEQAAEGFVIFSPNGSIRECNSAFLNLTQLSKQQLPQANIVQMLLPAEDTVSPNEVFAWDELSHSGRWRGEVLMSRPNKSQLPALATLSVVEQNRNGEAISYVGVIADISGQKAYQHQLEQLAHFDPLTGLPNQVILNRRLEKEVNVCDHGGACGMVILLDLDKFKVINDRFSHRGGNEILKTLAERLKNDVSSTEMASRLNGDEFVLLIPGIRSDDEAIARLERIQHLINAPMNYQDSPITLSACYGYALYPQDATDAGMLLRQADQAMYLAKSLGENSFHRFDLHEENKIQHQSSIRKKFIPQVEDFETSELELYYQPKIDYHTDQITGAEALIRWNDPEKGVLSPAQFLPAINGHNALEIKLSLWVMEHAARQWLEWNKRGLNLFISINLPAAHLLSERLIVDLNALQERHPDLPPGALRLEILETAALGDIEHVSKLLSVIHQHGFNFAIDDFGTGYASLAYLKHLPVQELKIDQSFVRNMLDNPDDHAIVKAIISLAHTFDLDVIAEGVETDAHAKALKQLGCMRAQGYGISRPLPAPRLYQWLQQREG